MKKRLLAFLTAIFVLAGLSSWTEAKSGLEAARDALAMIETANVQQIEKFFEGIPFPAQEVKKALDAGLTKLAWKISRPGEKGTWWVIYEHKKHSIASAYLLYAENPPEDAKVIQTLAKKERR